MFYTGGATDTTEQLHLVCVWIPTVLIFGLRQGLSTIAGIYNTKNTIGSDVCIC